MPTIKHADDIGVVGGGGSEQKPVVTVTVIVLRHKKFQLARVLENK